MQLSPNITVLPSSTEPLKWVIRKTQRGHPYHQGLPNYWNGSWSLDTFGERFATKYESEAAAVASFMQSMLEE